jgi:hypothetical protein
VSSTLLLVLYLAGRALGQVVASLEQKGAPFCSSIRTADVLADREETQAVAVGPTPKMIFVQLSAIVVVESTSTP